MSDCVVKVDDLVGGVMMAFGLAAAVEDIRGVKVLVEVVVGTATGEGFTGVLLNAVEVKGEETEGLERGDVEFGVTWVTLLKVLTFPHSASTSAMMSPPPEIESKVRRDEMSASKELRLLSPGTSAGSDLGNDGTCSLVLLTLVDVSWVVRVSVGVVGVLSCVDKLSTSSKFSFSGMFRERGWASGVSVRSSLMISTLLARDDMSRGLGGASSLSSLSFDLNITVPKRPFSPRRCRPTGWDTVWTWRSPVPLRPPLNNERKRRDLAEPVEEMELRE